MSSIIMTLFSCSRQWWRRLPWWSWITKVTQHTVATRITLGHWLIQRTLLPAWSRIKIYSWKHRPVATRKLTGSVRCNNQRRKWKDLAWLRNRRFRLDSRWSRCLRLRRRRRSINSIRLLGLKLNSTSSKIRLECHRQGLFSQWPPLHSWLGKLPHRSQPPNEMLIFY